MKKKIKVIAVLLCVCMISIASSITVSHAAEGGQDVPVSYSPSEDDLAKFKMQVITIGEGSVFDGTQELKDNTTVYELKYGDQKVFRAEPKEGYVLKSVFYNGKDVTELLSTNGTITIEGMNYDTVLTFTFEKISISIPEDNKPTIGGSDPNGPQTGESSNKGLLISTVLLSGAGIFYILYKKKKDEEDKIEG